MSALLLSHVPPARMAVILTAVVIQLSSAAEASYIWGQTACWLPIPHTHSPVCSDPLLAHFDKFTVSSLKRPQERQSELLKLMRMPLLALISI